ncbi:7-cyano-7-deazaguanine synthase QueC [candidate division WOR-3 bacterium]|nr:7-cyano-7-deazaguanine synthase QueC [candidate division WOR-3 bacterium]
MKDLAVILVSGGIDSCVTAAIANRDYELAFLHINYGQKTEKRELKAFNSLVDFYKVKYKLVCDFEHFKKIGGSSLIDSKMQASHRTTTYVPFRNANFLAVAVSWAEVIGAPKIFIGAVEEDAPEYPDCRKEFYERFNEIIETGTNTTTHIEVITPVISMQKYEIVKLGLKLNAPLNLTWSCYENNSQACGKCDSCIRRFKAFKLAGIRDPIISKNETTE